MINKPHNERKHAFNLFSTIILNKIGFSSEPLRYTFKLLLQNHRKKHHNLVQSHKTKSSKTEQFSTSETLSTRSFTNENNETQGEETKVLSVSDDLLDNSDRYQTLEEIECMLSDYLLIGSNKIAHVRHKDLKSRVTCILINTADGVLVIDPGSKNGFKINGKSSLDFDSFTGLRTPILIKDENIQHFKIKCHGIHVEVTRTIVK